MNNQQIPLILIADDDSSTRVLLRIILQKEGYQTIEVENGLACLNTCQKQIPDMILLDGMMPEMDGFTCCEKLQYLPLDYPIPILMITGLEDQESVDKAFAAGAIDYITKPIHAPVLRQRIQRILQANQAEIALKNSEKKYRTVVNSLKEAVFQTDSQGKLTFLNQAWQHITQFSCEISIGKNLREFIHPSDIPLLEQKIQQLQQNPTQSYQYQLRYLTQAKKTKWLEVLASPLVDEKNQLIGISGTLDDISDRRRQEQYKKVEYAVTKVLAESENLAEATPQLIAAICTSLEWEYGEFWRIETNVCRNIANWSLLTDKLPELAQLTQPITFTRGEGLPGKIWQTKQPLWLENLINNPLFYRQAITQILQFSSSLAVPVLNRQECLGIMVFLSKENKPQDTDLLHHLTNIGSQIGQFIKRKQAEAKSQRQAAILKAQLQQASNYVASLLPQPIKTKLIQIQQEFVPSSQLGGDIFDYYWLDENHLVIYLLDVAGHGVKSALLSTSVLNILRTQALQNTSFYRPQEVVTGLNKIFQMDDLGENYFTIWYGVYDTEIREMKYTCCGHPPAILINQKNSKTITKKLATDNIAIGLLSDFELKSDHAFIPPNSYLYLFSDGVYEILQANGKIWGLAAFTQLMKTYTNKQVNNLNKVYQYVHKINGNSELEDDFSLVQISF